MHGSGRSDRRTSRASRPRRAAAVPRSRYRNAAAALTRNRARPHPNGGRPPGDRRHHRERRHIGWMRDAADLNIDTSSLLAPPSQADAERAISAADAASAPDFRDVRFPFVAPAPRGRPGVRRPLPQESTLRPCAEKPLTGCDPSGAAFIATDPDYRPFVENLQSLIGPLLPRFDAEGKSYLTIAIGLHRRPTSLGGAGRGACRLVAKRRPVRHSLAPGRRGGRGGRGRRVEKNMIGIVLVTHGNLAQEFKAALEHVVGVQQCLSTVSSAPTTTWRSDAPKSWKGFGPARRAKASSC